MPVYMTQFTYTQDAWAAMVKHPEDRQAPLANLFEHFGCRLINLYYCFGEYDGVVIFEAPDYKAASASIMCAVAPGHLKGTKTTQLLTVTEALESMGKAGDFNYPAPKRLGDHLKE